MVGTTGPPWTYDHAGRLATVPGFVTATGWASSTASNGDRSGPLTVDENGGPAAPESIGFIGKRGDLDTNLLYLNTRWYDPVLGRFLTPDWWDQTIPGVGTNRYAYAGNDPIYASDRSGHVFVGLPARQAW